MTETDFMWVVILLLFWGVYLIDRRLRQIRGLLAQIYGHMRGINVDD